MYTFTGTGTGNFFAFVEDRIWTQFCWLGVVTQQGPQGYRFHAVHPAAGPNAFMFEKVHNNITQAWVEGGKVHNFCPGLDCGCVSCEPGTVCLDCSDDCICNCECEERVPCTNCWRVGCCAFFIPNGTGSHGLGANPHGYSYVISQISGQDPRVEFNLFDGFFDVFDSHVRIKAQGTYFIVNLLGGENGMSGITVSKRGDIFVVRLGGRSTAQVWVRHIQN